MKEKQIHTMGVSNEEKDSIQAQAKTKSPSPRRQNESLREHGCVAFPVVFRQSEKYDASKKEHP